MNMRTYYGNCHCGAISVQIKISGQPEDQKLGACQCSFCRKHNARTLADPNAACTLEVREFEQLQRYRFGLNTAEAILCCQCGVYVAMVLQEKDRAWSTVNVDILEQRKLFTKTIEPRDYDNEDAASRIKRRKARWTPTILVGWI